MGSGVEFDEDTFVSGSRKAVGMGSNGSHVPGFTGWLIRHRWAKNEKSAKLLELAIVILNLVITFILARSFI